MTIELTKFVQEVEQLVRREAFFSRCARLYELLADAESLMGSTRDWLLSVPKSKVRKRGSAHWRALLAQAKARTHLLKVHEDLDGLGWESVARDATLGVCEMRVNLATFYAGAAAAARDEAEVRRGCGRKSNGQLAQAERIAARIEAAAAQPGSADSLAKILAGGLGRSTITIARRIRKTRRENDRQ